MTEVLPESAGWPLVFNDRIVTSNPRYFQGTAVLDGALCGQVRVVRAGGSVDSTRGPVARGSWLRAALSACSHVVVCGREAALLITRFVGEPTSAGKQRDGLSGKPRRRLVEDLAGFLAILHDPETLQAVGAAAAGTRACQKPKPPPRYSGRASAGT